MDDIEGTQEVNSTDSSGELTTALSQKMGYLKDFQEAINQGDDGRIYELIDPVRYTREIKQTPPAKDVVNQSMLVGDLHADLSHYLSDRLINYLGEVYPFFYYDEVVNGRFQIYFGNWWGRRLFGELDVLNVAFVFDDEKYLQLARTVELAVQQKRYNTDNIERITTENRDLQTLLDEQPTRDQYKEELRRQLKELGQKNTLPWDTNKVKEERQTLLDWLTRLADEDEAALNATKVIRANDERILALSQEDTILNYEKQSILKTFDSFEHFEAKNASLYTDFLTSLSNQKRVADDDDE